MTAVYLFSEALNAAQIFAIYQLGLGYKVLYVLFPAYTVLVDLDLKVVVHGAAYLGNWLYVRVIRGSTGNSQESKGPIFFFLREI